MGILLLFALIELGIVTLFLWLDAQRNRSRLSLLAIALSWMLIIPASVAIGIILALIGGFVGSVLGEWGALAGALTGGIGGVIAGHVLPIKAGRSIQTRRAKRILIARRVKRQIEQGKTMLRDSEPEVRIDGIRRLEKVQDLRVVEVLGRALKDQEESVRQHAARALRKFCTAGHALVFRDWNLYLYDPFYDSYAPGWNQPIKPSSRFRLARIIIHADTCDMRQVEAFATDTLPHLTNLSLKNLVTISIRGNPSAFCSDVYQIFNACKAVDIHIHTVLFGADASPRISPATWVNPDVSGFMLPLSRLKLVRIHANTCDSRRVEAFAQYMAATLPPELLATSVTVYIDGNLTPLCLPVYKVFSTCKKLEAAIDTVIFGATDTAARKYFSATTWKNPDVAGLAFPLTDLKRIIIYPDTAQSHLLERFLTYAMEYLGQHLLKRQVEVTLYGDPDGLHPNLRNNLANLCKSVKVETAAALMGV